MKKKYLLWVSVAVLLFGACKEETEPPVQPENFSGLKYTASGTLNISIDNVFNTSPLVRFTDYVTGAGDTINIDQFRYYFSNVQLKNSEGAWINLKNYNLVGIEDETSTQIGLQNIPAGTYNKIKFLVGVEQELNHSGAQDGALSPINDMFWDWSTGYIFFRLKGKFNSGKTLALDLGGDNNLPEVELDLASFKKQGNNIKINLNCNVADVFVTPHVYDLKIQPSMIHSATSEGCPLLRDNIRIGVFSVASIE